MKPNRQTSSGVAVLLVGIATAVCLWAFGESEKAGSGDGALTMITLASALALLLALSFAYMMSRAAQEQIESAVHRQTEHLLKAQEETNRDLQRANDTLQESENRLAVTLNSIGDAVIATDAGARITRLNPVAEHLTGWTQAEALGRPVDEVFRILSKATRLAAKVPVAEALARGTIQGLANHTTLVGRHGSEFDIADSCAPIRDHSGLVIGAVLVFRNVTAEHAGQQALRDSTALIQTILNTLADGLMTIHAEGGIIETVNPAAERIFGYAAHELIGHPFSMLIPELDRDKRGGSLEYYAASPEERAAGIGREVVGQRKDGASLPLEIALSEMTLGGRRYFTGILRDITTRQSVDRILQEKNTALEKATAAAEKATAAAERANLAKSDFLSSMSHELRTPLSAILGFAQLIETGTPPPTAAQKRGVDQILKAGWYLLDLINEILDLAMIEAGRLSLSVEPISLSEVVRECQAMIAPQADKRGIVVTAPEWEPAYLVRADRTRLKQVLVNLLSNAVKYNRSGGTVAISFALSAPGRLRVGVRDTGEGLDADQLAQLFQPFNRLGREEGLEEGTGIGLVVSQRLIQLMGGVIGAESVFGEGSVFWIDLALASGPEPRLVPGPLREPLPSPGEGDPPWRTLLYIEDNPANLMLVEDLIARRSGIRLLSAGNASLGIDIARAALPDVILMDINLPGISGMEALRILAINPATARIPVVALSANAMPHDIKRGLDAGFFKYLTKPIVVADFLETLDQAFGHAQARSTEDRTS